MDACICFLLRMLALLYDGARGQAAEVARPLKSEAKVTESDAYARTPSLTTQLQLQLQAAATA